MTVQDKSVFKVNFFWTATSSQGEKLFQAEGDFLVYNKQSSKLERPPLTDVSSVSVTLKTSRRVSQ